MGTNSEEDSQDRWTQLRWQQLVSDVRWAKEQGWKALQWTVLLQAAVYAAARQVSEVPAWIFAILTFIVAVAGCGYVIDLHSSAKKWRQEALGILPDYVPWGHSPRQRHHVFYLWLQLAVVIGATTIVLIGAL